MAVDLNDITARINRWLAKNDLPREGVRVTIEFPTKDGACRAEMAIKREIEPIMAYYGAGNSFGKMETMNGVGLSLTHREN